MSRAHPANRLDHVVEERIRAMRRAGASVRAIRAQLLAEGERVAISTVGEVCKAMADAGEAVPADAEAAADDLAAGLEVAALESAEEVSAAKARLGEAIEAGNVDLAVGLAKALSALSRARESEIKQAQLLRGRPTSRGASVTEPSETDAQREARERLERLAADAEGVG